jgi:CheY-like chemotaxis protein
MSKTVSQGKRPLRLADSAGDLEKKKILIIDDEETFCIFAGWALEKTGRYEVTTVTQPLQGIDIARSIRPDLILLDIKMPYMDGSQLAEMLLEDVETKSIPIVFITGLVTNEETEHRQMEVAGRTFIAKPVTNDELVGAVGRILIN